MNKKYFFIALLFLNLPLTAALTTAFYHKFEEIATNILKLTQFNACVVDVDYVAGGVTVLYPADFFTEAPMVSITLELKNQAYVATLSFSATVTFNSAASTVIRINKTVAGGPIAEASTDDVTIHLTSVGPTVFP